MLQHRVLLVGVVLTCTACLSWYYLWSSTPEPKSSTGKGSSTTAVQAPVGQPMTPAVAAQGEQLRSAYSRMGADFATLGLDAAAIASLQPWFHGVDAEEMTWPKRYDQMQPALPLDSVRLLVIPLEGCAAISSLAMAATSRVAALLPEGVKVFANSRIQYHVTVFHSSHPVDPRPDPLAAGGGLDGTPTAPHERRAVSQGTLEQESRTIQQVVSEARAPQLELVSIIMTRSGTLLLTWVDRTNRVAELRAKLKAAFPGATSKQSNIIHSTLMRIVAPTSLPKETVASIDSLCKQLTESLKGRLFTPGSLWWVRESEFSTVVGHREVLTLAQ